ncbi:Uncharacterized protein GmHk_20G058900 [Glycine max]|nr:Uncharacterized protein GmHk_20G058900 [Glycine max]
MGEIWWSLLGSAIPVVVAGQAFRLKKRRAEEQRLQSGRGRERNSDEIFVCERVCTSKRMLKKLGSFSKDPIPDTCVTVCGVSDVDACADACARTVCINQHQVPNWNDICLRRCQSECLKLSSQSRSSMRPAGSTRIRWAHWFGSLRGSEMYQNWCELVELGGSLVESG